jgi:hypothetical protein
VIDEIDRMGKLDNTLIIYMRDRHALAHPAEVRRDLFGPGERRIKRPGPGHRHVRVGLVRSPDVVELHLNVDRKLDAVKRGNLVRRAD